MQFNYLKKLLGIQGYRIANLKIQEHQRQKGCSFGVEKAQTYL